VDEVSATLRSSNERTLPVECNHVEICRLSGMEGYYSTVSGAVVELIELICPVSSMYDLCVTVHVRSHGWA